MGSIVSPPGTRKTTEEYLDRLAKSEPHTERIEPEYMSGRPAVFIGEKDGLFQFAEGEHHITVFESRKEEITLADSTLMLRSYTQEYYNHGTDDHAKVRAIMEETNYFELTGI